MDFTSPSGRDAWKALLKKHILEMGTKTVWNDNCEMDGVEDREAQCDFEGQKGTMTELKILHSNMMAYTAKQALHEVYPGERPYIINRAGYAGIQRYAQVWGGDNLTDWRTLKFNIATILGMGISGCANMGCDIGGFAGPAPEEELLLRWISKDKGAYWVALDNTLLKQFIIQDDWEVADSGWYYDLTEKSVWVKFPKPKKDTFTLTISKEKFDLIGMTEE